MIDPGKLRRAAEYASQQCSSNMTVLLEIVEPGVSVSAMAEKGLKRFHHRIVITWAELVDGAVSFKEAIDLAVEKTKRHL